MEIRGIGGAGQGVCPRGTLAPALLASARSCASRSALHGSTARAAPPWAHPLARLMATTRACPRGTARDLLGCAGSWAGRSAVHGPRERAEPPAAVDRRPPPPRGRGRRLRTRSLGTPGAGRSRSVGRGPARPGSLCAGADNRYGICRVWARGGSPRVPGRRADGPEGGLPAQYPGLRVRVSGGPAVSSLQTPPRGRPGPCRPRGAGTGPKEWN